MGQPCICVCMCVYRSEQIGAVTLMLLICQKTKLLSCVINRPKYLTEFILIQNDFYNEKYSHYTCGEYVSITEFHAHSNHQSRHNINIPTLIS